MSQQEAEAAYKEMFKQMDLRNELEGQWRRWVVTLSSGMLVVLVALKGPMPVSSVGKWAMIAALVSLGASLLFGVVAVHGEIRRQAALILQMRSQISQGRYRDMATGSPGRLSRVCGKLMAFSFVMAVAGLVTFGVARVVMA